MVDRTYRLRALGDDYTLDYSVLVGFYADPLAAMRADGNEAPDDAYAGSFTFDAGDEDDGIIYFPLDPNLRVVIHEAAHAVIGALDRRGMSLPTRADSVEQEEIFVHTLGVLAEEIVNALPEGDEVSAGGVG